MKEDGYDDKSNVWPTIQKFICDRLPLKDVVWKSPISSSFINIEKLPIRFLPSSAKLFNETQHPYRRFLAPYVHVYLLCVESMDAYKTNKPFIKKWLEPYNNPKIGKQPWLVVYVPLGTSTMDVYQKINARLSADFYTEKAGDHSVMLILPPDTGSKRTLSVPERFAQQGLYQQSYASVADLLGKLRDGVVTSFQIRTLQYDADIRKLDAARGLPNFDFWQLFLVKESLALMYQMLQLPDRALSLYEELEMLLVFAPAHSLPASDWPVVIPSSSTSSSSNSGGGGGNSASGNNTPVKSTSRTGESGQDTDTLPASSGPQITASKSKRDLMTDACRSGEDIMVYSINTARMNILWNKFSLFQLQHYIFARQMYFLLVHLRQPTRCAEKALQYMKSSYVALEGRIQRQYPMRESVHALTESDLMGNGSASDSKMLQLRKAQADVWAVCASIKLIRECRALLQLLVGGDAKYNSVFNNNNSVSYNTNSVSATSTSESFSDNLAAISSASSHGGSVVYNSLAELNRSQHGISSHRKHTFSVGNAVESSVHNAYTTPAMAIREILFAPELDIAVELRDSSRVLGDLIEFALKRLQALSSSTVKNASKKALDLALNTVPFDYQAICTSVNTTAARNKLSAKRTVTKVAMGGSGSVANTNIVSTPSSVRETQSDNDETGDFTARTNAVTINNDATSSNNPFAGTNNTELTAVSPRNADLVVTIEQELSMLDESRESQGVADVGDRMDQILQSIAQKVRSTSHFWSKLYELSTPSHLLYGNTPSAHHATTAVPDTDSGTESGASPTPEQENPSFPPISPPKRGIQPFSDPSPGGSPMRLRPIQGENNDFSPDSSPFGSRAGTPIGTPVASSKRMSGVYAESNSSNGVGGIADTGRFDSQTNTIVYPSAAPASSTTLRKLISRHSSRSLVMSRSQLERGKLLELCLAVLGCSAQWHLQLLANRPRFALSAMLRCADLLMCNNQLVVAAKRLEEALQCGLLAPVAAYICGTHTAGGTKHTNTVCNNNSSNNNPVGDAVCEAMHSGAGIAEALDRSAHMSSDAVPPAHRHKSIFQQCLAEEQLHQQQYTQHLHTILSLSIQHSVHYPLYGAWTPLWHYTLRKLLYCLQQNRNYTQYRIVIANLLIPTSADGVNRLPMQPSSLLSDLLKEFIELSNIPSIDAPGTNADEDSSDVVNDNKQAIPQPLPLLHLPFSNYFDVHIGMVELNTTANNTNNTDDTTTLPPTLVSGYEVIREEWLQTTAVQIEGGYVGGYSVPIKLTCNLPGPLPVDAFYMVYKRFTADTIVHEMLNQDTHGANIGDCQGKVVNEGEYLCKPAAIDNTTVDAAGSPQLIIPPGTTTINMEFTPPVLGDYRLDRIVIVVGTAIFERTFLPSITAATLHTYSYVANDSMEESEHFQYDSSRVYSAGESAALAILKEYFKLHSIVQVLPPSNLLNLQSVVAPIVPLDQVDDAYFSLQVSPGEEVTDLRFKAWGREFDPQKSLSLTRAFDESRSVSISTSLRSQDMSPLLHAHKSHSKSAFNTSNSGSYTFSHGNPAPSTNNAATIYSGFVSAKDATPAARRVRRAPPIDTDEYEALQQANAAVASLLAQQGKGRDVHRSNDSGDHNGVVLSVKPGAEWTVIVSDKGTCDGDNSNNAGTRDVILANSIVDMDAQVSSFAAGALTGPKTLHVRIPFVASLQSSLATSDAPDSVVLMLEMSGTVVRGGCTIPISVTKEAILHICELVDMRVEVYPLYPTAVGNVYNMLLQCYLDNKTDIPIELTGYGLTPLTQQPAAYTILDGPTSLAAVYKPSVDANSVVVLNAGESYPAGLLLEVQTSATGDNAVAIPCSTTSNSEGLQFYFQWNPNLLLSQVYSEVYKHRVFTVQRALTQYNANTSKRTDAASIPASIIVPPYAGNGVTLSLYTTPALHLTAYHTSTSDTPLVCVKLGKVFSCQYTLKMRCPAKGQALHTNSDNTEYYINTSNVCAVATVGDTAAGVDITQLTDVTGLSAALCETSDWMVAGSTCRVLTTHIICKNNTAVSTANTATEVPPSAPIASPMTFTEVNASVKGLVKKIESRTGSNSYSSNSSSSSSATNTTEEVALQPHTGTMNKTEGTKWIEVSYELCWDMLPVSLGAAPLPPLKVEYALGGDVTTTRSVVYPDKMSAEDRVLVVPAGSDVNACGTRRDIDGCASMNKNFTFAMVQIK